MKVVDQALLDEIVRLLVAEFDPEQVILFGSHAWGEPDEDSDVDLFIVVPTSDETRIARAQRAHIALSALPVAKDVIVETAAEYDRYASVHASLEAQVREQGIRLYEREDGVDPRLARESAA